MPYLRKYGVATAAGTHICIPMIKRAVVDYALGADWTPAAGDVKVRLDDGAAANIATLPTAKTSGNTAEWEFQFSAAELQAKKIDVIIADAATKAVEDNKFTIETFGHASAMYQADLSAANLPANVVQVGGSAVSQTGGLLNANVTQLSGDSTAADNAESFFDGTGYAGTNNVIPTVTTVSNGVTVSTNNDKAGYALSAAGILAIWDQLRSAAFAAGSLGETFKAWMAALGSDSRPKVSADAHTAGATVAAVSGAVGSVTGAVGSVTGNVGGSVGSLATQAKADVNAEVDTALADINLDHLVKNAVDTDFPTTVHLNSVVGHLADNGTAASFDRTTDSLEAIRDRGDVAWITGGSVSGSRTVTFTVRDGTSLANLVDAAVTVYGSDGSTVVDVKRTNSSGQAVFSLDDGNYYYGVTALPGYSSVGATAFTVDGTEAITVNMSAIPATSVSAGTRVVRVIVVSGAGALTSGIEVTAKLAKKRSSIANAFVLNTQLTDTTDANGIADLTLITEDQFESGDGEYVITVPGAAEWKGPIPAGAGVYNIQVTM